MPFNYTASANQSKAHAIETVKTVRALYPSAECDRARFRLAMMDLLVQLAEYDQIKRVLYLADGYRGDGNFHWV